MTLLVSVCLSVCYSEDRRTASVVALPPGVECLTVDREYVSLSLSLSLSEPNVITAGVPNVVM